ncbi:TPA: hypothetical protein KD873_004310 [Vibrio parahaemolyticus]|nr:hypothetical protein [Vibrio parahaemolyticus]
MSNNNYSFSKTQKKNLKQLLDTLPRYELASGSEAFLLGYIAFESVSRMVWNYYRSVKANKKINETHAPLPLPTIKSAFKAYNIKVSDVVLDTILNSEKKKRGEKSARNLRNGLVHQWKYEDRKEVLDREHELIAKLSEVIEVIKNLIDY